MDEEIPYYEDGKGGLVVTDALGPTLEPLIPYYLKKIREYYEPMGTSENALLELGPADFANHCHEDHHMELDSVILRTASSVVAVSIFKGVQRIIDCSGFVIGWDESQNEATILTSARLLKIPEKDNRKDYYIAVRSPKGKISIAQEDYVDFYNNIATFKFKSDEELDVINLDTSCEVQDGTCVVALGRDFFGNLLDSVGVLHKNYPYFGCQDMWGSTCTTAEASEGGPLITTTGAVCGLNFCYEIYRSAHPWPSHPMNSCLSTQKTHGAHPLPIHVISSCLKTWKAYGRVVVPWFGLSVIDSTKLSRNAIEKLRCPCFVHMLLVKQVYEHSPASQLGVRPGDLAASCAGRPLYSSFEYAHLVQELSEELSAKSAGGTKDWPDIEIYVRKVVDFDEWERVKVNAEIVPVSDRKLCAWWPKVDDNVWYGSPRFGSQTGSCITSYTNHSLIRSVYGKT